MKRIHQTVTTLALAVSATFTTGNIPALAFNITQNKNPSILKNILLGNTTGLSDIEIISPTGSADAFGTFQNDPFGLNSGVVLSTGRVEDLAGGNTLDGDLDVTRANLTVWGTDAIYLAGRTDITIPIPPLGNSFVLGRHSYVASDFLLETFPQFFPVSNGETLTFSASGGVDYYNTPSAKYYSPDGINAMSDIQSLGGINGYRGPQGSLVGLFLNDNNPIGNPSPATLDFSSDFSTLAPDLGQVFLIGDGLTNRGLTQQFITPAGATRLFLGIADGGDFVGMPGLYEDNDGSFAVLLNSNESNLNDLSTDFGFTGTSNDDISLAIEFNADATAEMLYLQYVFGSEEFIESALVGRANDAFSIELNGFNMAVLSNGAEVGINTLAPAHPDFIYNPVGTGPANSQTKLDGYTKPLTFAGFLEPGMNRLEIKIKDGNNGLLDSAVFLKGGTLGTVNPSGGGDNGGGDNGGSTSIPEPSSSLGILIFSALSITGLLKKRCC